MKIKNGPNILSFTRVNELGGWFGNFSRHAVEYDGKRWPTTEHLFQALRFPKGSPIREEIRNEDNPKEAKTISERNKSQRTIQGGSKADLDNMRLCLRLKVVSHPNIRNALLATGDKTIIEDVTFRPNRQSDCWGMRLHNGLWEGENLLGNLWMELRTSEKTRMEEETALREQFFGF